MAAKTYRLANTLVNSFQQMLESDQTAATLATGWTVGKTAALNDSDMLVGTQRATTAFSLEATTAKPTGLLTGANANAFRSDQPISGEFAAAAWSIVIAFRSVSTAYSGTIRARVRVYKSVNADGTGATELTTATQIGTTTAAGSTSADTTSTVTWTPGSVLTLDNEYLFIAVACEIVTASGSNTANALLRTGTSTTGCHVITSNFNPVEAATIAGTTSLISSEASVFTEDDPADIDFLGVTATGGLGDFRDTTTKVAIPFTPSANCRVANVVSALSHFGTPTGNLIIEIRTDLSGLPSSTVLGSTTFPASDITTSDYRPTISFATPISLAAGTRYWLVFGRDVTDTSNFPILYSTSTPILAGQPQQYKDTGSGFVALSGSYAVFAVRVLTTTNTPNSTTQLTSDEVAQLIDSVVVSGVTSLSSSEDYTPAAGVNADSATISTVTAISTIEVAAYVDQATVAGTTALQTTEIHEIPDAGTGKTITTIISTDVAAFVDAGTVSGVTQVIGSDVAAFIDAATIASSTQLTSIDVAAFIDAGTATSVTSVSTIEVHEIPDVATIASATQVTSMDIAQYVESATIKSVTTPSTVEIANLVDSATISSASSLISSDLLAAVDAALINSITTPSAVDIAAYVDLATISGATSLSSVESRERLDSATIPGVTAVSSVQVFAGVDASTIASATTFGATDIAAFVDAAAVKSVTSLTALEGPQSALIDAATLTSKTALLATDTTTYVDADTPASLTALSSTEVEQITEAGTVISTTTVTSTDIAAFVDTNTMQSVSTLDSSEVITHVYLDSGTIGSISTVFGTDVAAFVDADIATSTTTLTGDEVVTYLDINTIGATTSLVSDDLYARNTSDADTVVSITTLISDEFSHFIAADFIVRFYRRWRVSGFTPAHAVQGFRKRWTAKWTS